MLGEVASVKIEQMDDAAWSGTRREGKLGSYVTSWSADYKQRPRQLHLHLLAPKNSVAAPGTTRTRTYRTSLEQARSMTDMEACIRCTRRSRIRSSTSDFAFVPLFHLQHLFAIDPRR
jgi:peptide/nickel transport system substrate-binding protein/oligopeptide transport system substrate-binding protein